MVVFSLIASWWGRKLFSGGSRAFTLRLERRGQVEALRRIWNHH